MSKGVGRGRGWLNLAKNAEPPRPGALTTPENGVPTESQIGEEYRELLDRIKLLNSNDDGILFNKKMKHIRSFWQERFHNLEDVERSFEEVYNAALYDSDLGSKLVTLLSSQTFLKERIHDCNFRSKFLKRLQSDFENSNQLQTNHPAVFRNIVTLIGEFYNKSRLGSGKPFVILGTPMLACLDLLLDSKLLPDLKLLVTQIYLNGTSLKTSHPEELSKLAVKARQVLVMEPQLDKEAKLWLLLALDLFNVRFGVLPAEVYKFYEEQLGPTVMINFQCPQDLLSIQTVHTSKVLDKYQSNVNVLQISTSPTEVPPNDIYPIPYPTPEVPPNDIYPIPYPTPEVTSQKKEKPGRPILGAGARFIKNNGEENGTNKKNSTARSHKKPLYSKGNKGWEHDDRFENDYN